MLIWNVFFKSLRADLTSFTEVIDIMYDNGQWAKTWKNI